MSASDLYIQDVLGGRTRVPSTVVGPDDFVLGSPRPLAVDAFLRDHRLGLFALDRRRDDALFVRVDDPARARAQPFLYEAQRAAARAVIRVPIARLLEWTDREPIGAPPILCYSTARSGSTLLVRALDRIPGLHGVSEPDVFTQLAEDARFAVDPRAVALLRACNTWLFGGAGRLPGRIALKFRTQVLATADRMREAWPAAPTIFLHRALLPSVESFVQAFVDRRRWRIENAVVLGSVWRWWLRFRIERDGYGIAEHLWPPPGRPPVLALAELGSSYQAVAYWLAAHGWAARLRAHGVDVLALDYDDLVRAPATAMRGVLRHCGLPVEHAALTLPTFREPSQRGSLAVHARDGAPRLARAEVARLTAFLLRYGPHGSRLRIGAAA